MWSGEWSYRGSGSRHSTAQSGVRNGLRTGRTHGRWIVTRAGCRARVSPAALKSARERIGPLALERA